MDYRDQDENRRPRNQRSRPTGAHNRSNQQADRGTNVQNSPNRRGSGQFKMKRNHNDSNRVGSGYRGARGYHDHPGGYGYQDYYDGSGGTSRGLPRNREEYGSTHSLSSVRSGISARKERNRSYKHASTSAGTEQNFEDITSAFMSDSDDNSSVLSTNSSHYGSSAHLASRDNRDLAYKRKDNHPKIAVYWDIENCPVPSGKSALHLVKRIRETFYLNYTEDEFVVVCDTGKQKQNLLEELHNAVVEVKHVNSCSKNASDDILRRNMREFATRNSASSGRIILISGDINFVTDVHDLRYKRHFEIVLVHNKQASEHLLLAANQCFVYEEFSADLPVLNSSSQEAGLKPVSVVVFELPKNADNYQVKGQLIRLFQPFGGIVKHPDRESSTCVVEFKSRGDAERAKNRIHGEKIFGSKIGVRLRREDKRKPIDTCKEAKPSKKTADKKPPAKINPEVSTGNATKIAVVLKGSVTLPELMRKIKGHPDINERNVSSFLVRNDHTFAVVDSESLSKAKKAIKFIQTKFGSSLVRVEVVRGDQQPDFLQQLISNLTTTSNENITQRYQKWKNVQVAAHQAKIRELFEKLKEIENLQHCFTTRNEIKSRAVSKNAVKEHIDLMSEIREEFVNATNPLIAAVTEETAEDKILINLSILCILLKVASPTFGRYSTILSLVESKNCVVISGFPGTGKSTQLLMFILNSYIGEFGVKSVVCVQPTKELVQSNGAFVCSQITATLSKGLDGVNKGTRNSEFSQELQNLYITSDTLLKECIADPHLAKYKCIILDEIQWCQVSMDLLLIYLTKLMQRKGLKIVLLSTPEQTESLTKQLVDLCVVEVKQGLYYVDIIHYTLNPVDVVKESIDMALKLYQEEPEGDILVFLAHPSEVIYAASYFRTSQKNVNFIMLLMVTLKDTRKKLQGASKLRRIILTCGGMEELVSIPTVRVVIDCGFTVQRLSRDSWEVIETQRVSYNSAYLRASQAGNQGEGKCYRMYTPQQMHSSKSVPSEKQQLHLMILKLLQMNIDPTTFSFTEDNTRHEVPSVLEHLENLGAIHKRHLTEFGKIMAVIPLQPHLSALLLKACDDDIGYNALLLCSVASVSHLFTSPFVNVSQGFPTGNLVAFVEFIDKYLNENVDGRKKMLAGTSIDPLIMTCIQNKITEVHVALKDCGMKIKLQFSVCRWKEVLTRTILKQWNANVCVLHSPSTNTYMWKAGNSAIVQLVPSALPENAVLPKFIAFGTLLRTERGLYASDIIPLENTVVMQASKDGHTDVSDLMSGRTMEFLYPLSHHLIRTVIVGARGQLLSLWEQNLSVISGSDVTVTPLQNKGQVAIIAPAEHQEKVLNAIKKELDSARRVMEKELWEYCINKDAGIRIVWGRGATVTHFLQVNEFISVLVFVKPAVYVKKVVDVLKQYGFIKYYKVKDTRSAKKQIVIMYDNPAAAKASLQCKEFDIHPRFIKGSRSIFQDSFIKATLTWTRRKNLGTAILQFQDGTDVDIVAIYLENEKEDKTCLVECKIQPELSKSRIIVKGLAPEITKCAFEEQVKVLLSKMVGSRKLESVQWTYHKLFTSTKEDVAEARNQVEKLLFVYGEKVNVTVKTPNDQDEAWEALLGFADSSVAKVILESLSQGSRIDGSEIRVHSTYACKVYCKASILEIIRAGYQKQIIPLMSSSSEEKLEATTECLKDSDQVLIMLQSCNLKKILAAFELLGCMLSSCYSASWSSLGLTKRSFEDSGSGRVLVETLKNHDSVHVEVLPKKQKLVIYGSLPGKSLLEKFCEENETKLENEPKLFNCGNKKGQIKKLVENYGSTLSGLAKEIEASDVFLDVKKGTVAVRGTMISWKKMADKMFEFELSPSQASQESNSEEVCPVCKDEIKNAENNYRMELCGHAYCLPCIYALVENSPFPLKCLHPVCNAFVVFRDLHMFQIMQQDNPKILERLAERAIETYREANKDNLKFCPVSFCDGLIPTTSGMQVCSYCLNTVCTGCECLYHYTETCSQYQERKEKTEKASSVTTPHSNTCAPPENDPIPKIQIVSHPLSEAGCSSSNRPSEQIKLQARSTIEVKIPESTSNVRRSTSYPADLPVGRECLPRDTQTTTRRVEYTPPSSINLPHERPKDNCAVM